MAEQGEQAFMKTFLNTLASQPLVYADDYQQPPENSLKKVPTLSIPVPTPPKRKLLDATTSSSVSINVTFKSLKPPAAYTISVHPTDTIASIKTQLASEPTAPPADAQRLLLKGKALADGKLLQEYTVKEGDTINLVVKPGFDWDPSKAVVPTTTSSLPPSSTMGSEDKKPLSLGKSARGHQRIPSVVLSPSPSAETPGSTEKDILLTLDSSQMEGVIQTDTLFEVTISKPEFWERLYTFLRSEFDVEGDALSAFENFFRASKGALSASQIAKIRDQIGIVGMAGT